MNVIPQEIIGLPTASAAELVRRVRLRFAPPEEIVLAAWAEANISLPPGQSAMPGRYHNWPYMVDIINDIGDPEVEQVSFQKAARLGFTKGIVIAIAAKVATDPCPIGLLVPTEDEVRGYSVDEIDPLFEASPTLHALLIDEKQRRGTMKRKAFKNGATLKILAARSPRNLRRHTLKVLYADEIDAMEVTTEGDPLSLAEKRTLTYPDRKLVWGSTPTLEDISNIERKYQQSDMRVFEIPCPHCEVPFELLWQHIQWPQGKPEEAAAYCPGCGCMIDEDDKTEIVNAGRWRPTKPEIEGHHGYKLNSLVSMLANATWPKLAAEYLQAKRGGPSEEQVFQNTVLGETYRTSLNKLDAEVLAARAEEIGVSNMPPWVVMLTVGADVQDDRIEASILGWGVDPSASPCVLAHHVIDGNTLDDKTWSDFDLWLRRQYEHPNGWSVGIDAAAIDSGGSAGRTQKVYDFTSPRYARRIYAIKGASGARPMWARAQKVTRRARLFIIGVDQVKTMVMERLALEPFGEDGEFNPLAIRISNDVPEEWYEGVTGETRRIRYVRNRPVIEFIPKKSGQPVEALDALIYGWAVRLSAGVKAIDLKERAARAAEKKPVNSPRKRNLGSVAARLNG